MDEYHARLRQRGDHSCVTLDGGVAIAKGTDSSLVRGNLCLDESG
jgi:hypothetical protein